MRCDLRRIVCIGNRLRPEDAFGPLVYDALLNRGVPDSVELIEGGLAGLNLLWVFDDADVVVFVDAAVGLSERNRPIVLGIEEAAASAAQRFDHAAGLPYLLRAMLEISEGRYPKVRVIACDGEPAEGVVEAAADMCLGLIEGEGEETPWAMTADAGIPA